MKSCLEFQSQFVDAFYNELNTSQQQALIRHLEQCESCRIEFNHLQTVLKLASNRTRPEPNPEFIDNLWERLAPRLQASTHNWLNNLKSWWHQRNFSGTIPAWSYRVVGVVAIFLIGVWVGYLYFKPESTLINNQTTPSKAASTVPLNQTALKSQALDYIERSKILLLGFVNYEPLSNNNVRLDLTYQQKISRELIGEAAVLKPQLTGAEHLRLLELISDLEIILLQITNYEKEFDLPAIELISSGVENQALLLKINIEEMKLATQLEPAAVKKPREKPIKL